MIDTPRVGRETRFMPETPKNETSRRDFLRTSGRLAAAGALTGVALPHVHAAVDNTIRVALIGCGGRGTGAADNAMSVSDSLGPVKLHAMADVFEDKMEKSFDSLQRRHADKMDVTPERKFIGFDGFRNAMDTLRKGDVAIFTTPCAFRWPFFEYAISKDLNVFMEKPVTPDGPSSRKMLELNKTAKAKNLKVGVGLMCRHCVARGELFNRIQDGEIGDITMLRAYRMQGPIGSAFSPKNDGSMSELMYQIRRFHSFLWLSGGSFSDFFIHNIDESCWMKNDWPVEAQAIGGRHYRGDNIDQNFDSYSVEYTFKDGTKLFLDGRNVQGSYNEFASYAHGTKGSAVISTASHSPAKCRTYKNQKIQHPRYRGEDLIWAAAQPEPNPYQLEWEHLIEAIRRDEPYNEVERGVMASVVTSMGRMAAHTGQVITLDQMLNCPHQMAPGVENLTIDSDSPLRPDKDGKYPIPMPGILRDREYEYEA